MGIIVKELEDSMGSCGGGHVRNFGFFEGHGNDSSLESELWHARVMYIVMARTKRGRVENPYVLLWVLYSIVGIYHDDDCGDISTWVENP